MPPATEATLDPDRWQRLKGYVADLADLVGEARAAAEQQLPLDSRDRALLRRLLAQLDPQDARLAWPLRGSSEDSSSALRWQGGATVDAYVVDGFLGRGGMSEVYAAHRRDNGATVALKVLRRGLAHSDLGKFSENEGRALRRLDDPHIARFIDSFVLADAGMCLVLERIDGESLDDWCASRKLGIDARLGLYLQICHAVASAHRELVVHRDLKPANVLVCADGNIKLLDFGVAKLLEDEIAATETHGGLYTLEFAAPEQVLREPVSAATDIYALGALLFRLLTGASAYALSADESLVKAVLSEHPRKLAQARAPPRGRADGALDRDLDLVIQRAMEKDPRDRYRSAMELAQDVQSIRAGIPIRAGGGRWYRLTKFVRRHRTGVAVSSLLTLALLTATSLSLHWAQRAEALSRSAASEARRAGAANRFLLAVLDLNDSFSQRNSGDLTLTQVLDRAVQLAGSELADEPEVRADVLSKLSVALQRRGQLERSRALASEAVSILAALSDQHSEPYAEALRRLASTEIDSNQLDEAAAHLNEALHILDALEGDHRLLRMGAASSLARIASARGDPLAALGLYQSIVVIRSSLSGDHRADAAMDYGNLGAALLFLSRFDESAAAYRHGIELLRARLGDHHPRLGLIRSGYATPLIQLGRLDEARAELLAASALMASNDNSGERNRYEAVAELNFASIDYWVGDHAESLRRLDAIQSGIPATHLAGVLLLRGRIAQAQGDNAQAAAAFSAAEARYVETGGAAHPRRWLARGMAAIADGEADPARRDDARVREALDALAATATSFSADRADLLLQAGSAARRRGDYALAAQYHLQCADILHHNHWLGDLGRALIDGELSLDRLSLDPSAAERTTLIAQLDQSVTTLAQLSPGSAQVREFRAAKR